MVYRDHCPGCLLAESVGDQGERSVTPPIGEKLSPRLSTLHGEQLPGPRNTLEFMLTAICERDTRPDDEILDGPGDQDLSGSCQRSHPSGDVHGQPSEAI